MKKLLEQKIEWLVAIYFIWWFGTYALNLFEIFFNISTFLIVFYTIRYTRKTIIETIEEEICLEQRYQEHLKKRNQEQKAKVDRMFKMLEKI